MYSCYLTMRCRFYYLAYGEAGIYTSFSGPLMCVQACAKHMSLEDA